MTPPPESETRTFAEWLTGARPEEARLVLLSALYFFFILSAYYVIRPIREEMAVAGGVENIPWLFTGTLTAMLLVHPIFAAVVSRWTRRRFVTLTYRFFMLNLLVYFVLLRVVTDGDASVWIGRTFFVWISVFNLFVVSVFWSFMTDIFRERQSRRLFGLIGVGGTVGGIVGSAITASLVGFLSPATLLLFSVLLLEGAVVCLKALDSRCATSAAAGDDSGVAAGSRPDVAGGEGEMEEVIGGSALEGIRRVVASPYLLGIGAFMLLFTIGSTFLYNIQADIISRTFATGAERTSVFARIDLSVNILTLCTQLFLTGRILKWLGVRLALGILPVLSVLGFLTLGAAPVFAVFVVFQVLRRAGNFALAVPTREVLYTVLPRRDKYKAKNFNDLFVYRAGDQIGVWSFAGLRALGLGSSALALTMVPLAGVWLLIALWLGKKQAALARSPAGRRAEAGAAS
ncbi:MAG: MFS transporter [Gemmatimonadota bacterium]|nr:MFS transporter [Gemmatimonadota bacterium]